MVSLRIDSKITQATFLLPRWPLMVGTIINEVSHDYYRAM